MVCQQYQAFYLHASNAFTVSSFSSLSFKVNGGTSSQVPVSKFSHFIFFISYYIFVLYFVLANMHAGVSLLSGGNQTGKPYDISSQITANTWTTVNIFSLFCFFPLTWNKGDHISPKFPSSRNHIHWWCVVAIRVFWSGWNYIFGWYPQNKKNGVQKFNFWSRKILYLLQAHLHQVSFTLFAYLFLCY